MPQKKNELKINSGSRHLLRQSPEVNRCTRRAA
jgi:hypothetical protein